MQNGERISGFLTVSCFQHQKCTYGSPKESVRSYGAQDYLSWPVLVGMDAILTAVQAH